MTMRYVLSYDDHILRAKMTMRYVLSYDDHVIRANMTMRYVLLDRGAAGVLNTFMCEEVIILDDDMSKVIDRNTRSNFKSICDSSY